MFNGKNKTVSKVCSVPSPSPSDARYSPRSSEHSSALVDAEDEIPQLPVERGDHGGPRRGRRGSRRGRSTAAHDDARAVQEIRLRRELHGLHGPRDGSASKRRLSGRASLGDGACDQAVRVLREPVRLLAVPVSDVRSGRPSRGLLASLRD